MWSLCTVAVEAVHQNVEPMHADQMKITRYPCIIGHFRDFPVLANVTKIFF